MKNIRLCCFGSRSGCEANTRQKTAALNGYLATTTDSLDRQKIATEGMVAGIANVATAYNENADALARQEVLSTQLAIIEGVKAQQAGEAAARQREAAEEAERQTNAISEAYEVYARTRAEGEALADAADRAGVSAASLSQIAFGNIAGAATDALRLAGNLGIALDTAARLAALGPQGIGGNDPSGKTYSGRGGAPTQTQIVETRLAGSQGYFTPPKLGSGGGRGGRGGGGGGGGGADRDSFDGLQKAAKDALAALDLAIAQINEKVSLGLMSTAEATDAIGQAKERAAGNVADLIPKLEKLAVTAGPKGAEAVKLWREQVKGLVGDLKGAGSELSKTLSDGFKSPFADFIKGAASGKDAFNDFGDFVIDKLADMAAQKFTDSIIAPLFEGLFSGGGGLGGLLGSIFPSAKGNVIPHALGGIAGYSNSIVDRPTLFAMGGDQTGLMGEAGKEAILPMGDGGILAMFGGREGRLPLERGAGGRLGVRVPNLMTAADRPPMAFAHGRCCGRWVIWPDGRDAGRVQCPRQCHHQHRKHGARGPGPHGRKAGRRQPGHPRADRAD